jgi:hypothetical protein
MLKALAHRFITSQLERPFGYDAGYLHALADASLATFAKFTVVTGLVRRGDAPAEALAAAGIVGTLAEDCGPCTQISVDLALKGGARPKVLRAILAGDEQAMGEDALLGYHFARAALARDLEEAERWRDAVTERWGRKGLVALSLALTTARMYPTLKYAMGYGKTCSKVTVAGADAPFAKPDLLAA